MEDRRQNEIDNANDVVTDNLVIKATSDLFMATLLSAPKNEPILRGLINAVLTYSGQTPIKSAEVLIRSMLENLQLTNRSCLMFAS